MIELLCILYTILIKVYTASKIGATRKTGGSNRGYKPLTLTRA